jgi:hypothetical protein
MQGPGTSYFNIHNWLTKNYIKKQCENTKCSGKSKTLDWALIHGLEHTKNRENYLVLCRSCHILYDMTDERRKNCSHPGHPGYMKGKKHSKETKDKMKKSSPKKRPWLKNKPLKEEHKNNIGKSILSNNWGFQPKQNWEKVNCEHCGTWCCPNTYKRYHGTKCKYK